MGLHRCVGSTVWFLQWLFVSIRAERAKYYVMFFDCPVPVTWLTWCNRYIVSYYNVRNIRVIIFYSYVIN